MSEKPAPLSNNTVPRWAILTFGLVFLALLLALPFTLFYGMARTQNQSHGMNLALASGLPFEVRDLRPTSRENPELGLLAAHYLLPEAVRAKVAAAMTPAAVVPEATLKSLRDVSPKEPHWAPEGRGPWFVASGVRNGLDWRAVLDASTGALWVVAVPVR